MEASPFFEKVHTRDGMIKKETEFERKNHVDKIYWTTAVPTSAIQMSNGANFKLVSSVHNLLGLSVVTGTMSELAFFREAGKSDDYIMRIFNDLKGRIDSRMKGNYFGRSILDSSPNTLDSPIDAYVVNEASKDPKNYIVKGSEWEWAPDDFDMNKTFQVYTGGKGQPPKIIDEDMTTEHMSPARIIEVPLTLKQYFIDDLYKALKDRAGIPAGSADSLIYDYNKIENVFNAKFKNIYTHLRADEEQAPSRLIWDQIEPIFFKEKAGVKEFWYKPHIPRCIAIDQSINQDVSCIAMSHVERIPGEDEQMFITDFTIPIAPEGKRINLDAIKLFIQDLRDIGHLNITNVSYDQFQSESAMQYLRRIGFNVEKISVDVSTDPYLFLLSLLNTKRFITGRNLYVKNNFKSLKLVSSAKGKKKVDHEDAQPVITSGSLDWDKSMIGMFAKDSTDAIACSIELLRRYHPVAYDAWDPDYLDRLISGTEAIKQAQKSTEELLAKFSMR